MSGSDDPRERTAEERARAAAERAARRAARQGRRAPAPRSDEEVGIDGVDVPPPDAFGLPPASGPGISRDDEPPAERRRPVRGRSVPESAESAESEAPAPAEPAASEAREPAEPPAGAGSAGGDEDVTRVHRTVEPPPEEDAAPPATPPAGAAGPAAIPAVDPDRRLPDESPAPHWTSAFPRGTAPGRPAEEPAEAPADTAAQASVPSAPADAASATGDAAAQASVPPGPGPADDDTRAAAGPQHPGAEHSRDEYAEAGAYAEDPTHADASADDEHAAYDDNGDDTRDHDLGDHDRDDDTAGWMDEPTRAHPVPADVPFATARPVSAVPADGRSRRGSRRNRGSARDEPGPERRRPRWGRRILALLALLAIGAALYLINATFQPFHGSGTGAVRVEIPEGANVAGIGELLERRGVVASGEFFNLNVTLTGRRGRLRPGDYTLQRNMSYGDASEALMQGPKVKVVETFDFTIPEGLSRRDIAALVKDSAVRGSYLKATAEPRFRRRARELGLPRGTRTLEGFLFPATYELTGDATARDLVAKQLDSFEQNFSEVDMDVARRRNLTRYDVVTIASMVEREASLQRERPLVAAVIHNRLRAGMPLGIDATIRYATDNWTRPIRQSELEADGPYNTRLRQGLPPTPIGNPGLASLQAAANPGDVEYLYYVVKPGTCGEHAFSSSAEQFERDSERYNAARAAQGGQSPTNC